MADFKATAMSGSLTRLVDGTQYLQAGSNVTINHNSNGSITIAATAGSDNDWTRDTSPDRVYPNTTATTSVLVGDTAVGSADIILSHDGAATFNEQGAAVDFRVESDNKPNALLVDGSADQVLILSGGAGASVNEAGGTDVAFYVSGTQGSQGTSTRGSSLFGGDTIVSGALHARGAKKLLPATNSTASLFIDNIAAPSP